MQKRDGGMAQVVEVLSSNHEVLSSNSSTTKKKKKTDTKVFFLTLSRIISCLFYFIALLTLVWQEIKRDSEDHFDSVLLLLQFLQMEPEKRKSSNVF
jgi:hypothetical protein